MKVAGRLQFEPGGTENGLVTEDSDFKNSDFKELAQYLSAVDEKTIDVGVIKMLTFDALAPSTENKFPFGNAINDKEQV